MTTVALHQPNYVPWLGYFYKLGKSDVFVFLDDVQFSKQSYTNRVKILSESGERWLTQPVTVSLGQAINEVALARGDWARAHLDTLRGCYGKAAAFRSVWPDIVALYADVPGGGIAETNRFLVERIAEKLHLSAEFRRSSEFETNGATGDDRLVEIVVQVSPGGTYLSGKGGSRYQDEGKFAAAGLSLAYADFDHPRYEQDGEGFVAGLSVLDAVFHLGWAGTSALLRR